MRAPEEFDRIAVVLVRTRNPLNIGAAARAMSNFGFGTLRVVAPFEGAWRSARSAVHASQLLTDAVEFGSVAEAVADCSLVVGTSAVGSRRPALPIAPLASAAENIRSHLQHGRAAVLFGSEKRGLSNDDLSHCNALLRIPTREPHDSMNLGQAVAVCLYELARSAEEHPAGGPARTVPSQASAGDLERMTDSLFASLRASSYVKPGADAATLERARLLVRRMQLSAEDAQTLTGMLAKMLARLDAQRN